MTKTISIHDNTFVLHPSAAIFWKDKNTLLISDVHLGKVSHFRKHGVAVPESAAATNFERLDEVVGFFKPEQLIFLGDLFHSKKNKEWQLFENWTKSVTADLVLVVGNHDVIAQRHYGQLNIKVTDEIETGTFLFTHHPEEKQGFFNFCGHIHPAIKLYGTGRQSLKLPCFFQKENQLILPAFGEFTGTFELMPVEKDCVYAIANGQIITVC